MFCFCGGQASLSAPLIVWVIIDMGKFEAKTMLQEPPLAVQKFTYSAIT